MKEIRKNIKEKQFHKVYLLTGDEGYLIFQARQMLKKAMVAEGDEMNYTIYEENKVDLAQLGDLAMTFPFFSEKRLIVLNQTEIMKNGKDELVRIFENLPDTTCLVICDSNKPDSRTKVYKWIKKNGYVADFQKKDQSEKTLLTFVARILAQGKKKITETNARYMISLVGEDLYLLCNEAEKLISYLGEETVVSKEAIDAVISEQIENKIYDLIRAIAEKKQGEALKLYNNLMILKEDPISILSLMVRQYRLLIILKTMNRQRKSRSEMAKTAGLSPWAVDKMMPQTQMYSEAQLQKHLDLCVSMETEIKTGQIDKQIGVEALLITLIRSGD